MSVSILSRRALGALAATSLLVGLLPAVASAATPEPRDITEFACPPGEVPDPGFSDDENTTAEHKASIACVVWYELAAGRTTTTYAPGDAVNRGQMATFIGNLLVKGGVTLSDNPPDAFADDDDTQHEKRINQLAELGVVEGDREGKYNASFPVTRAQMASFLNRAYQEITGAALTSSEDYFTDDNGAFHEKNINAVAEAGIAAGTTSTTYAPGNAVKRDQMATFLARETDLLVEKKEITKPPAADVKLHSASVEQGGKITGEIATGPGVTLTSAKVSGCGLTDQALTLVGENNAFDVTIPATQPQGECSLTFTLTREGGAEITDTETITVTGVTSETDAPELATVSAATPASGATEVTVTFTFDEPLNSGVVPDPSDFALYGASAERHKASSANLSGTSAVSTVFSRAAYDAATTAAVSYAAVEDQQSVSNPEGSFPLKTSSTDTGITEAPDLVDVEGPTKVADSMAGAGNTGSWTFHFDEPAYRLRSAEASDFELVLANGDVVEGTGGAGNSTTPSNDPCPKNPDCSRTIQFTFTEAQVGKAVVRGTIEQGTVSDDQTDTTDVQPSGNVNPQQAHDVSGGGDTPYLTDISIDPENNQVTYVFNRGVSVVDTNRELPGGTAGHFRAYRADASEVENSSASTSGSDNRIVIASFSTGIDGSDPIPPGTVGGSVNRDAVQTTSGNQATNRVDERAKPQAFVAGRTAAPDLLAVQRSVDGNNSVLTFFFDQTVTTESGTDGTGGALTIYQQDGRRNTLRLNHPLTNECETSGAKVVCEASSSSDLGKLIDSAVLGGVEHATVEDSTGNYRNYESSRGIAG